jgi:predicted amidohydrolase YtcJ
MAEDVVCFTGAVVLPDPVVEDGAVVCRGGMIVATGARADVTVPTRAPLADVIRMATLTPAERVGVAHEIGSLEAGKRADVVLLDQALNVRRVFMGGSEYT